MEHYKFSQNKDCEFFPCHKVKDESTFNCLFCFCPLYMLGRDCGGRYEYLNDTIKDCSSCLIVHSKVGYDHVMSKMTDVMEKAN